MTAQDQFYELSYYTLAHPDPALFIHQYIVDAYTAQTADVNTKPIAIVFSIAGLYLYMEKNYTGREVQLAHMQMSKNKSMLPQIILPESRGSITVADVLKTPPGKERDAMICEWCRSVWNAFSSEHEKVISATRLLLTV